MMKLKCNVPRRSDRKGMRVFSQVQPLTTGSNIAGTAIVGSLKGYAAQRDMCRSNWRWVLSEELHGVQAVVND